VVTGNRIGFNFITFYHHFYTPYKNLDLKKPNQGHWLSHFVVPPDAPSFFYLVNYIHFIASIPAVKQKSFQCTILNVEPDMKHTGTSDLPVVDIVYC